MHDNHWALIAHGGAKHIYRSETEDNRQGLKEAVHIGSMILSKGGSALDAVVETVKNLESHPAFNAGIYGSVRNEEGDIEMDASLMDGKTLDIGAFAGVREIEHPIVLANALLRDKAICLVGIGVVKFAREHKLPMVAQPEPLHSGLKNEGCDTVGCVARDKKGNLAVATSTGGLKNSRVGRVGDVPMPGCGFYADNERGAVSCSGEGESIARVLLASHYLQLAQTMRPGEAAEEALKALKRVKGEAGLIAITPEGKMAWAHNSQGFAVGMASAQHVVPQIYMRKKEEQRV